MSDIFFTRKNHPEAVICRIEASLKGSSRSSVHAFATNCGKLMVSRPGDSNLWAPLYDADRNIYFLVLGRPVLDLEEMSTAKDPTRQADQGKLTVFLYKAYLCGGMKSFDSLHGSFVIAILDTTANQLSLRTDKLGILPVFMNSKISSTRFDLSTNPDLLAKHSGAGELDFVSLAEHIRCGRVVHPYTHYKDIRELDFGSIYEFDLNSGEFRQAKYWAPRFVPDYNKARLVEDLAQAIVNAVRRRTETIDEKVGVFLSGGADSRNILFGAKNRRNLYAMTLCDVENDEVHISQRLAARAGVPHHAITRDLEYYPRNAPRAMELACGMWNFVDGHFVGIDKELAEAGLSKLVTGCYADFLFKGLTLNRAPIFLGPKKLPIYKRKRFDLVHAYLWLMPVAAQWERAIQSRLWEEVGGVHVSHGNDVSDLEVEARRIFPLSRAPSAAGRSSLWRLYPWEPVFADNKILDVYQRIPPAGKLNADIFFKAVTKVCNEAGDIPCANNKMLLSTGVLGRAVRAMFESHVSQVKNDSGVSVATNGSWPDWVKLLRYSHVLRETWLGFESEEKEIAKMILGFDPWKRDISDWLSVREVERFNRLYSLLLWHGALRKK
jgi:asparagine synthase (glutamine-hydrolysing)